MLEVRNLSFSYDKRRILKDVSFSVAGGERVCLVGANGAGKTTLLRVMATLAVPDGGSVLLDGQDAFARPLRYRRRLGYLPERFALYEDMRVKDFLAYRAGLKGEPPKRIRRRISEAAQMCMLDDALRSPIRGLSAGEKKRVALADALLLRPRLPGSIAQCAKSQGKSSPTRPRFQASSRQGTRLTILRDGRRVFWCFATA